MWISSNYSILWFTNSENIKINTWSFVYNKETNKQSPAPLIILNSQYTLSILSLCIGVSV